MNRSGQSSHRWRVHQPPLRPEPIVVAIELERALAAEVALEHLAVIAHALDDTHRPSFRHAERIAEFVSRTERASECRVLYAMSNVRLSRAALFRRDEREEHPSHERKP